jgi:ABC-type bacteriocin/lantibiotic exporter with double-glycine peptidase domain
MKLEGKLTLGRLVLGFKGPVSITWLLLLLENALMALMPLLIGLAIDGLLDKQAQTLFLLGGAMAVLIVLAVGRRMYDSRAYGAIKLELGKEVEQRLHGLPVSVRNTRQGLADELIAFLEVQLPEIFSASIQILVSAIVLASIHWLLGWAALSLVVTTALAYSAGHRYFYAYNRGLNSQMERQVALLSSDKHTKARKHKAFHRHLHNLKDWQVKLSDMEAWVYGAIFGLITLFICHNLWISASLESISAGMLFTIITYSWEFAEAALALPMGLQSWTRLSEISTRLNQYVEGENLLLAVASRNSVKSKVVNVTP